MTDRATGSEGILGEFGKAAPLPPVHHTTSIDTTTGLIRGATVITTRGLRQAQDICVGDLVITRDGGVVPVTRIEQQSLIARAVYILAGSIGHHRPDRDTMLPAGQPLLVRDWRARALSGYDEIITCPDALVDGEFVRDLGMVPMTVYRLFCQRPQIIYADGMELGTADAAQVEPQAD